MTTLFPQIKRVDEDETSKIIKNVLFSNQDDTKLDKILEEFMHLTEELSCSDVDDDLDDVEIKAEPRVLDHQPRQQQHHHHHHRSRPSAELTNGKSNLNNHDKNGPVRNKPSDHSGGENDDEDDGDEDDEDEDDDDIDDEEEEDDEDSEDDDDDDDDDDSSESDEEKQESTPPREPTSWNLDQFIKSIPAKQKQQPPPPPPPASLVTQSQTTPALESNNHHHHNNNHSSILPSSQPSLQPSPAQTTPQPKHSKHHKHQKPLELAKEKEKEREIKREPKKERDRERELEIEREKHAREVELEKQRQQQQRELEKHQKLEQQRELEKQQQLQQQRELEKQRLQQQRELDNQQQREIEKRQQQEQREIDRKPQLQDLQQQQQQRQNEKHSSDKESCIVQIDLSKLKRIPQTKAPTPNVTGSSAMITAKALKHEADAEKDKTKQAIKYLESCMYFVLHGHEMATSNNDTQYYSSVTPLFKHVVRMTSPISLENLDNMTNLKINALAKRCLSLLQMKMYKARERDLPGLIKTISTLQTSSPIHQADEVLIPVRPPVLSAYKRQAAIFNYLKAAHDYWHSVEQLCDQHPALRIFFSTIESNCGPLTMVSPFPKLMDHVQCGLKLLRTS